MMSELQKHWFWQDVQLSLRSCAFKNPDAFGENPDGLGENPDVFL